MVITGYGRIMRIFSDCSLFDMKVHELISLMYSPSYLIPLIVINLLQISLTSCDIPEQIYLTVQAMRDQDYLKRSFFVYNLWKIHIHIFIKHFVELTLI